MLHLISDKVLGGRLMTKYKINEELRELNPEVYDYLINNIKGIDERGLYNKQLSIDMVEKFISKAKVTFKSLNLDRISELFNYLKDTVNSVTAAQEILLSAAEIAKRSKDNIKRRIDFFTIECGMGDNYIKMLRNSPSRIVVTEKEYLMYEYFILDFFKDIKKTENFFKKTKMSIIFWGAEKCQPSYGNATKYLRTYFTDEQLEYIFSHSTLIFSKSESFYVQLFSQLDNYSEKDKSAFLRKFYKNPDSILAYNKDEQNKPRKSIKLKLKDLKSARNNLDVLQGIVFSTSNSGISQKDIEASKIAESSARKCLETFFKNLKKSIKSKIEKDTTSVDKIIEDTYAGDLEKPENSDEDENADNSENTDDKINLAFEDTKLLQILSEYAKYAGIKNATSLTEFLNTLYNEHGFDKEEIKQLAFVMMSSILLNDTQKIINQVKNPRGIKYSLKNYIANNAKRNEFTTAYVDAFNPNKLEELIQKAMEDENTRFLIGDLYNFFKTECQTSNNLRNNTFSLDHVIFKLSKILAEDSKPKSKAGGNNSLRNQFPQEVSLFRQDFKKRVNGNKFMPIIKSKNDYLSIATQLHQFISQFKEIIIGQQVDTILSTQDSYNDAKMEFESSSAKYKEKLKLMKELKEELKLIEERIKAVKVYLNTEQTSMDDISAQTNDILSKIDSILKK